MPSSACPAVRAASQPPGNAVAGLDTDFDGQADDETLYWCQDANHNATALVDAASGNVVERIVYGPYGRPTFYTAAWAKTQFQGYADGTISLYGADVLFAGYRYDFMTGLYSVRRRVYHPTMGRWLQRDPLGYVDGMGLYEYCGGGPLSRSDPGGCVSADWWKQSGK